MPTFEDLPVELTMQIVNMSAVPRTPTLTGELFREGKEEVLCNLRLVSRHLDALVSPGLFSYLRLGWNDAEYYDKHATDSLRCQEIINALASRSTSVFKHTRRLHFHSHRLYRALDRRDCIADLRKTVKEHLFNAITGLKNLQSVNWCYDSDHDPEFIPIDFIRALGTLESFEGFDELSLPRDSPPSFSLKPLSNLRFLRISWGGGEVKHYIAELASLLTRCPNLTTIALRGDQATNGKDAELRVIFNQLNKLDNPLMFTKLQLYGVLVTPADIEANIHHFRNIKSLAISSNPNPAPSTYGEICLILKQNGIFLTGLSTDSADHPALLEYLTSYSGLRDLRLKHFGDFPEFADKVYQAILPKHRDTLRSLALGSNTILWTLPPTDDQLARIVACQKLRVLEFHYTPKDEGPHDTAFLSRCFETGTKLPELVHLHTHLTSWYLTYRGYSDMQAASNAFLFMIAETRKFKAKHEPKFWINDL